MTTYKYYDEDYINKCIDLINQNLELIGNKFSYTSMNGNTITNNESILLKTSINRIQECLVDIKECSNNKSYVQLITVLDNLNRYYQNNPQEIEEIKPRKRVMNKGLFRR